MVAAGAFFLDAADFIVFMTVLLGVFAFAAVPHLEEEEADAVDFFVTTVPVLASLLGSLAVVLAFRLPRVAAAAVAGLLPGLLPVGLPEEEEAAAAAAVFLVRAAAVDDVELELVEDAAVTFRAVVLVLVLVLVLVVVVVVVVAVVAVVAAPRVPFAFSTMFDSRFGLAPGPLTGDAGRANTGFAGEAGRSRAGTMRAFEEVGDRTWPGWADGGSTVGTPRILFLGCSTAPWFSLSALLISSLWVRPPVSQSERDKKEKGREREREREREKYKQ